MRPACIPPHRPQRETPQYQTILSASTAVSKTAVTVTTTLGQTFTHRNGRKGKGLPFWLNKEKREQCLTGVIQPLSEEKMWELGIEEK